MMVPNRVSPPSTCLWWWWFLLLITWTSFPTACQALLKLPTFVASHMVLQRDTAVLWGWTDKAHSMVTIDIYGSSSQQEEEEEKNNNNSRVSYQTQSSSDDHSWSVTIQQDVALNTTISISDWNSVVILENVAFGDVFLCSGQSNMEMSVGDVFDAEQEIFDSSNYELRMATVARNLSDTPNPDVFHKGDFVWRRSGPDAFSDQPFSYFSAACYFFGRTVYGQNRTVPIGLIASSWGGQRVETFSSADALSDETCGGTVSPSLKTLRGPPPASPIWDATDPLVNLSNPVLIPPGQAAGPQATQIWNAMIHPLIKMRIKAVVWYQGEANADSPSNYACRFPAMIADWRSKFDIQFPFLYVQLAAYDNKVYPALRASQEAALQLPNVVQALAIDIGDPTAPFGPIHPRRKQEVGRRLALARIGVEGPKLESIQVYDTSVRVRFDNVRGLHWAGTAACQECCNESPFEVFQNGTWTRAPATILKKGTVELRTGTPVFGVRFLWKGYPQCALYLGKDGPDHHRGLPPASPFQWCKYRISDNWSVDEACGSPQLRSAEAVSE